MEKHTEEWAPTGVTSIFQLSLQPSTGSAQRPTSVGAGVQYTAICGFGWRFAFQVDQQSAVEERGESHFHTAPAVVVDDAGNMIESFQLQLFFDPHLIRSAAYGAITLTTQLENLISVVQPPPPVCMHWGTYVYASSAPTPTISITVTLPASLGLTLPQSLQPQMEQALEETLSGKELVDSKFYAFSRRGTECVTHPLALFAKSALLRGFSDDLDAMLIGHGFSEATIVDLDLHQPDELAFRDYGYESDSDLDSEGEDDAMAGVATGSTDGETKSALVSGKGARVGRVFVLRDTAFKTWKALLYYLYTRRVNFRPLKSEGPKETTVSGPACSPKSMYRLADKLGLEELQALALASISSRLSESNILEEVFSSFTSVYPVIQELEVGVLTSNFSDKAAEGLKDMTQKICDGEKPYCAETLFKIIQKMGGKA
ncbi:hypothetical protein DFH06DRAFT_1208174 [Mycena polygramma]|nr:hypothetical protein DFH06DRAFT_1208174 [Mycena polygramma]